MHFQCSTHSQDGVCNRNEIDISVKKCVKKGDKNHGCPHSHYFPLHKHSDPPAGGRDGHNETCMNYCPTSVALCLLTGEFDSSFAATCGAGHGRFEASNVFHGRDRKTAEENRWCQQQFRKQSPWLLIEF